MPPILYLVRHAHASDAPDDAARQLSRHGHEELKQLARVLRPGGGFQPQLAWHSPLVRARETAEVLLSELRLKPAFATQRELEPEAHPATVVKLFDEVRVPLALFGHEPHLGHLASLLVAGSLSPVVFAFQKATVLALEPAGRRWCVRWQVSPDLFARP